MASIHSKVVVLAHRGNLAGPSQARENTLAACEAALAAGFGLEIDLRRDAFRGFLVSHDPVAWSPGNALLEFGKLFRSYPDRVVAVNVKDLSYLDQAATLVRRGTFGRRAFLFDFELLEPATPGRAQREIKSAPNGNEVPLASRLSDRHESIEQCLGIPAEVAWVDEFDGPWLTAKDVKAIHAAGRQAYMVSPELHGFDSESRLGRWLDFKQLAIDGICTDFAEEAREFFQH